MCKLLCENAFEILTFSKKKKKVQYECVQLMEYEINTVNTVNRVNKSRKLLKSKISPNRRIQIEMHTSLG